MILLTHMEHHANVVPWHMLAAERGITIRWVPLTSDGQLDLTNLDALLDGVAMFGFTAMSNVLGAITPVAELCRRRPPGRCDRRGRRPASTCRTT